VINKHFIPFFKITGLLKKQNGIITNKFYNFQFFISRLHSAVQDDDFDVPHVGVSSNLYFIT
jgi:hypothetical protein